MLKRYPDLQKYTIIGSLAIAALFACFFLILSFAPQLLNRSFTKERRIVLHQALSGNQFRKAVLSGMDASLLVNYVPSPMFSFNRAKAYLWAGNELRNKNLSLRGEVLVKKINTYLDFGYSLERVITLSKQFSNQFWKVFVQGSPSNTDAVFAFASDKERVLVNSQFFLSDSMPERLIPIPDSLRGFPEETVLASEVLPSLVGLCARLEKEFTQPCGGLLVTSAYRSYDSQLKLRNRFLKTDPEFAAHSVALPGHSEHQTGYAFDLILPVLSKEKYDSTPQSRFVAEHAHEYGLIVRYLKGKESITGVSYEPWHLRYVGDIAKDLYFSGLTYEEFLMRAKSEK